MSLPPSNPDSHYTPDHRLSFTYEQANQLNQEGLEALCPSYIELSEISTRYEAPVLLGNGAIKEVYRTYDNRAKRWVAMALLRENRGPDFYDLFVHEAWLTSSLSHPNIIKIYDVGVNEEGRPYFAMDLKGNTSLADLINADPAADLRDLLNIFTQLCDAMAYAHSRGVIHLDLKPENIQTDDFGETLVCDWGLAKVIDDPEQEDFEFPAALQPLENTTLVGLIKGTPGYMAPEQTESGSTKDHRTDIFSLGCILHTIITRHPPFVGSPSAVLDATSRAIVTPPRLRYPDLDIPKSLEAVVMKALQYSPNDRYDSALELKEEISNFLRGHTTRAERPGLVRETCLFIDRNRVPVLIAFLSFLVLTTLSWHFIQRIDHQIRATMKEKDRGTQLAIKTDAIQADYKSIQSDVDAMKEKSLDERKKLATKLAKSGNSLKNLGIHKRPVLTVKEAYELSSLALELDPNCPIAISEIFSLHCLSLNFKGALKNPPDPRANYRGYTDIVAKKYLLLAQEFPEFSYDHTRRPSIKQLASFLRKARTVTPNQMGFIERVLGYDLACRGRSYSYPEDVMLALLQYLNGGKDHLICRYNPWKKSFFLWSDKGIRLLSGSSGDCVLRFTSIQSLKLDIAGRFYLSHLQALPIESLDLSKCPKVILNKPVSLPFLREVRIRKGQLDITRLKNLVHTTKNLNVVITAEEK